MTDVPDEAELERLGLYDPSAPGASDRLALMRRLFELGGTAEEIVDAARTYAENDLALDLALRPPGQTLSLDEFAASSELDPDLVRRLWSALGLPASGPVKVAPDTAETLALLAGMAALFKPESAFALARVMGSSMARLAEALIGIFRVDIELPERATGSSASAQMDGMVVAVRELLPGFIDAVSAVFRRHMVLASYQLWSPDEDRSAVTHERTVGFADLVSSTEVVRASSVAALGVNVRDFEELVWDLVTDAGGRLVKLIGDEAMFVIEDPQRACHVALDLVERSPHPIRVGLAHGTVAALYGDYYGATVNLAARLVGVADASSVLVSESVRQLAAPDLSLSFDDSGRHSLKGFDESVPAFLVRHAGG
jgi:class 3 adenylate cyclase